MSIDFIPIYKYTDWYYHVLLVVTLITFFHTQILPLKSMEGYSFRNFMGPALIIFILIYMGFRPDHSVFVDMRAYSKMYDHYAQGGSAKESDDPFFQNFVSLSAKIMSKRMYFLTMACLYTIPLYVVSKKWFKEYWFYCFLFLVGSFSFWAYGTNGLRNGIAGSLVLLGFSRDKRIFQILWILLAINFHKAILLPVVGFAIVQFYNVPLAFYILWFLCIPLSLAAGGFWEGFFGSFIEDERGSYLTEGVTQAEKFKSVGFRWDFLFYSSFGVIAGWYYIFIEKIQDKFYIQLYNTYLFANAFWILVIRANFSNRFAYLSWFMMAVIIAYPWAKYHFVADQHRKFGLVMLAHFGFTYAMHFVYYG